MSALESREPLSTDAAVGRLVTEMIGAALRRQVWTLFLDGDDRPCPLVIPVSDLPDLPGPGEGASFAHTMSHVAGTVGATALILVWERPGAPHLDVTDRTWLRALHDGFADQEVDLRAILVSHLDGVSWARRDDYGF
jgi:hypothetical protein